MANARITSHIRAVAARSPLETAELAEALVRLSWPGSADGTDAISREWLRRWTPKSAAITPDCRCAAGRCAWCN